MDEKTAGERSHKRFFNPPPHALLPTILGGLLVLCGGALGDGGAFDSPAALAAPGDAPAVAPVQVAQAGVKKAPAAAGKTAAAGTAWKVVVNPPPAPIEWPEQVEVSIPIPGRNGKIIYPSTPSPFVALGFQGFDASGAQSWNVVTGEKVGEIRGKPSQGLKRVLSPDGKFLAVPVLSKPLVCKAQIWSFETGELVQTIDCDLDNFSLMIFDFVGPDQFLTHTMGKDAAGKLGNRVKIWSISTGQMLKQFNVNSNQLNQLNYAFSPGRQFLASIYYDGRITVYDLQSGAVAGSVLVPLASNLEPHLLPESMRFSDDGQTLAVLMAGPKETRIYEIDVATGKRDSDRDTAFPGRLLMAIESAPSYEGPKLAWLPHDAGYLLAGDVWIDGPSGRIVWFLVRGVDRFNHTHRFAVPNGIVVPEGPDTNKRLAVVEVPWKKIQTTLEAIDDEKKSARIRPGQAVSLNIQIGKLQQGDATATTAALVEVFTERLASDGIEVAEGQDIVLNVGYGEAAGQLLAGSTRNPLNPLRGGTPTGQSVQATQGALVATWQRKADKKPIWTGGLQVDPQFLIIRGDATEASARDSMFEGLKNKVFGLAIPYFIPEEKEKQLLQLPGYSELRNPTASAGDRTKMRLDANKKRKKK